MEKQILEGESSVRRLMWGRDLNVMSGKRSESFSKSLTQLCSRLIAIIVLMLLMYGLGQYFMDALSHAIDVEFQIGAYEK